MWLAITFLPVQVAWAGERWDKLSMGAKSVVGNIIGAVSPNAGNYIKTTNFGVGQRMGCIIDRGGIGITTRGIDSMYKNYVSPAVNQISNNSYVSALTGGLGYIRGGIKTGLVSGESALTKGLSSIPGGIKTGLVSGRSALKEGLRCDLTQLINLRNNTVNKYAVLSKGITNLRGRSSSLGIGGFFMRMTKTATKIPATAELSVLRSRLTITKTPISNVSNNASNNKLDLINLTNNWVNRYNARN